MVQELIEWKANVDLQDNHGWSALMVASQNGHFEIVQCLLSAGAIPDLKNKEVSYAWSFSPFHLDSMHHTTGSDCSDVCHFDCTHQSCKGIVIS